MEETSSVHAQLSGQQEKTAEKQEKTAERGYKWLLNSTGKFLFATACLTASYRGFLLADELVLFIISYLLGDLIGKYSYVETGFEGLRIFSALLTGLVYLFHLLYAVYDQVLFIMRFLRHQREVEEL